MNIQRFLGATALVGVLSAMPTFAFADAKADGKAAIAAPATSDTAVAPQATADPQTATETSDQSAEDKGEIVITGSRIRRPNDTSPIPITTLTNGDIFSSGRISVGDVLNQLPQMRADLGSQNSTAGLGTSGQNFLNLRDLDRSRTLVLINGRRQVTSDIINNGNAVDVNTISPDLIDRIDIITGGNSSVYGSDAIAGVVNFILKDDFEGIRIHGQNGISRYNDAGNQFISLLAGTNFANGRGNITLNGEFSHQSAYYASDRPALRQNNAFVTVDTDTGASSDDVIDRAFYRDIRSTTISGGGQLGFRYSNSVSPCGKDAVGSSFTCAYLFQPDGSLTPQTGLRVGLGPNGSFVNGNGYTSRDGRLVVLSPDLKRYAFNALGHFEISPAFVPFFEAKYVRTEVFGSQSGPFFSQGTTLQDGIGPIDGFVGTFDRSYSNGSYDPDTGELRATAVNREGIRLDNPYLSDAARATIAAQLTASINSGVNPNTGASFTSSSLTPAQSAANQAAALAQVAAGTYRFSLRRNWTDFGMRDERTTREIYRAVLGVRGDLGSSWHYEVSGNYSEHHETNVITGNVNVQRYLLAVDTARDPVSGKIVCRSQLDPAYGGDDFAGNSAQLASDIAACVPLNPFGEGSASSAAKNYLVMPTVATGKATQFVANGFVSGNLFNLPGGPVGVVVGGEYRRETLFYDLDPMTQAGYAFYNAIPTFKAPAFEVKEAFGEISLPLLKDLPLIKELTVNGSGRISDYKGGAGTVFTYSAEGIWRPISDLTFRGSYSKATRAPYLGNLYAVPGQNYTPAPLDPCSARNINTGSATREANCNAAGRPAGYDYVYTASLEIMSGGNPDLKSENSNSLTIGTLLTPSFLPGLSLSVDYYNITVNNVITSPDVQSALNACYDSPTLDNQFCALFQRAGADGGPNGEQPFQIIEGSYQDQPRNYAKLKARGIDVNLKYNHKFNWGALNLSGDYSHVLQRSDYTDPSRPDYEDVQMGELGNPQDQFRLTADLKIGRVTFGWTGRYIGPMYLNTYEDYNSVNGEPPQNPDYAPIMMYPSVVYHDIRTSFDLNGKFTLEGGIDNLTNQMPPYGLTGVGTGSGIYDNRGRYMYVGVTAKF